MELNCKFLPQFKIQQPQFTWVFSKQGKIKPLFVVNIFSRDNVVVKNMPRKEDILFTQWKAKDLLSYISFRHLKNHLTSAFSLFSDGIQFFPREAFPVSYDRWKNIEVHCNNDQSIRQTPLSKQDNAKLPELSFNRLQQTDDGYCGLQKRNFGRLVAREAMLDEEYWTAAWLRAEAHWESVSYMRHVDAYKRKYAEQEFYALKRRCSGQDGNCLKCFCFVAVKKEEKNVRRTVLNSVVGTLDLTIRQFVQRERYPGEIKRLSAVLARQDAFDSHKYAYIANVCVAKFARRQGIASNMIHLAADVASLQGFKQLFVHVNADNIPGQELYKKTGFKVVEEALSSLSKEQRLLMSLEL